MRIKQRYLRVIARRFWGLLFTFTISLAVVVQIMRETFPLIDDYRTHIGEFISQRLKVEVELGQVEAVWSGMRPRIRVLDVALNSPNGDEVLSIKEMRAELSLIDSLRERKLAWRQLSCDGVTATLEKTEQGRWRVRGLETPEDIDNTNSPIFDDPLDIFLIGRYVALSNVSINAYFPSGLHTQLNIPRITLGNDRDFHRIVAQVGVDSEQESLKLILEGHGDPRVPADFDAAGYLSIHQFPMEKVIAALPGKLWRAKDGAWRDGHRLDLELWFEGNYEEGLSISGELSAQGLPLNVPDYLSLPSSYNTKISGQWGARKGFDLTFQDFFAQWQTFVAPKLDIRVTGKTPKNFELSSIDVESWHRVLVNMGVDKSHIGDVLVNIAPKGSLHNVEVALTDKSSGYFSLKANLLEGSIKPYLGIPELKHVDAVVEVNSNGGTAYVESENGLVIGLPRVFKQPLAFDLASGRINWHLDWKRRFAYLGSGLLSLKNPGEEGKGYLHLTLPFNRRYGESQMTLSLGVEQAPLKNYSKYVPITVPPDLYQWLHDSVGKKGKVKNLQFLYNGSLDKAPEADPVVQLIASVEGGDLAFDTDWPPLKGMEGSLYMDNNKLDVSLNKAKILKNTVSDATVTLVDNPHDKGQALLINGSMSGSAAAAMALLKNSPIQELMGSTFDSWKLNGQVSSALKLFMPLESKAKGMHQQVNVTVAKTNVDIQDLDLEFKGLRGNLMYDSNSGLTAKRLDAKLWGKAVRADINSPKVGVAEDGSAMLDTHINFRTDVDVADVKRWTLRPELAFMEGTASVDGRLIIPAENTKDYDVVIQMSSFLEGVAFNLPEPVNKEAASQKKLSVDLKIYDDYERYEFAYDNLVKLRLLSGEDAAKDSIQLSFGPSNIEMKPGYFDVIGAIPKMDLLLWGEVHDQYFAYEEQMLGEGAEDSAMMPVRVDLDIAHCSIGETGALDVNVSGEGREELWDLDIASAAVSGKLKIYADEHRPVIMALDYLHLPEEDADSQRVFEGPPLPNISPASFAEAATSDGEVASALAEKELDPEPKGFMASVDLAEALPVDFSVKELSYGGKHLGNWSFDLRPYDGGVVFHNIQGDARGVHLNAKKGGGQFVWMQDELGNRSSFMGKINVDRGGDVLEAWEYEKILDAASSEIEIKVTWEGAPDEIALENIKGKISFAMKDGNFIRGAQQGENPLLRLIALFNFDTIARRLRLDFSDLAKEGFAFDKISADFEFADGKIFLHHPVIVDSSSSKMQLAGIVDMVNEEIDAQLVVTLPVAGDLTLATALVAGLPAAVGVFVVSKIFRKQVDKASSINYQISGAWVDPKIKFKRIFDDTAARKKADEVKGRDDTVGKAKLKSKTKLEKSQFGVGSKLGHNGEREAISANTLPHEKATANGDFGEAANNIIDTQGQPQIKATLPVDGILLLEN